MLNYFYQPCFCQTLVRCSVSKERNLTQEQLGELVGVQKAQISRLESNASNVTIDTLMKVFTALKAKVKLQIELPNAKFNVAK